MLEEEREREEDGRRGKRGTRGKIGRSDGGSGDKRRPGNHVNCRLSSPGGGSDRNYDWRGDGREQRDGEGGRELGNERTWPSGSALSRKPSRRSGPIKRPPLPAFYHFNSIFQYGRRRALFSPFQSLPFLSISRSPLRVEMHARIFIVDFWRIGFVR